MIRVNHEVKTLKELTEQYPYKWVVLENFEVDDAYDLVKGELVYVCDDDEISDIMLDYYKKDKLCFHWRTCEGISPEEAFKYAKENNLI